MKNQSIFEGIDRRRFLNRGEVSLLGMAVLHLMNPQSRDLG
jgi:hypothetical protein